MDSRLLLFFSLSLFVLKKKTWKDDDNNTHWRKVSAGQQKLEMMELLWKCLHSSFCLTTSKAQQGTFYLFVLLNRNHDSCDLSSWKIDTKAAAAFNVRVFCRLICPFNSCVWYHRRCFVVFVPIRFAIFQNRTFGKFYKGCYLHKSTKPILLQSHSVSKIQRTTVIWSKWICPQAFLLGQCCWKYFQSVVQIHPK